MADTTKSPIVVIPETANLQLPDDSLLNFYEDIDNRIFWVNDEINIYTLNLIHYILKWNREDASIPIEERKPIKLLFFSPGGDLDMNYAIIDTIKLSQTPIVGINLGMCASAAAYIFLSCHKRLMMPHAYFLFHQGSGNLSGTFEQIISQVEDYQDQVKELAEIIKGTTTYSVEDINEKINSEWYVRQEEALNKGVVHKVISNISDFEV